MKDLRCLVGFHRWQRRQVEDSQYLVCARCGRERDTVSSGPLGRGLGGIS